MNFNANSGGRPSFGRKIKRVSDVNSMGYNPSNPSNPYEGSNTHQNLYPTIEPDNTFQPGYPSNNPHQTEGVMNSAQVFHQPAYNQVPYTNVNPMNPSAPGLGVLNTPVMQDMAMQYGQQLAGAGTAALKNEVEKIVPISKLKYYFAVDSKYVMSKMMLLLFPFTHKQWSVKYEGPVQPRFEINAPDLYIPIMAYITYVVTAGLVLGTQQRFTPEQLGILASSALAWWVAELAVYSCTLYVIHVETRLSTFDLVAYSGYKFIGIIVSTLFSLIAGKTGYYSCLVYINLALAFFLTRSLKVHILTEGSQQSNYYDGQTHATGHKRRVYFLLFVAGLQPLLSWWLSYHLLPSDVAASDIVNSAL